MTATSETVLDLLDALVSIDSVKPGLHPAGAGEAQMAAYIARWGRSAGLHAEVLEGTPGRPGDTLAVAAANGSTYLWRISIGSRAGHRRTAYRPHLGGVDAVDVGEPA